MTVLLLNLEQKSRAVRRTLPRNCLNFGPTGLTRLIHPACFKIGKCPPFYICAQMSAPTLFLPFLIFPSPFLFSFFLPPPSLWTRFQFPLHVDRHSHLGDLAFFLCFQVRGRLEGGERWKVGLVLGAVSASVNTTSALQYNFPWILLKGEVGAMGSSQDSQLAALLWADIPQSEYFTS